MFMMNHLCNAQYIFCCRHFIGGTVAESDKFLHPQRIPDKFVQKFGDELSSIAKFTIPSGRMWFVELKKCNKQLWFDIGWHEFIEHCSIHSGYFLIFKYQGNSNFNVYIFDLAISEIEYPSLEEPSDSKQCHVPIEKDKEKNSSLRILPSVCAPCPDPFSPATKVLDEGVCYKCNKDSTSGVKIEYLHIPKDEHNQETAFHCPQDKGIQFKNTSDEVGLYFNCGTKRKISGPGQITNYCMLYAFRSNFVYNYWLISSLILNVYMNH